MKKDQKKEHRDEVIKLLKEIAAKYDKQSIATHLAIALSEYPNYGLLSDKELAFALDKYKCEKDLDMTIPHSSSLQEIIDQSKNLSIESIFNNEDEEDY